MAYVYLTLAFAINAVANILLKIGAGKGVVVHGSATTLLIQNWQFILGLGLFAANVLFYFLALRSLPLSVAYPIMVAMSFLIINGFALFGLRESVTTIQIVGYALIVVGLTLVVAKQV